MLVQFRGKRFYVHRLVAEVHVPNPNPQEYREIDHKDRNPGNNSSSNLRWCDRKIQMGNRQVCYDSLARYGVRSSENKDAYNHAYYAENGERIKAAARERYASDPEYAELKRQQRREYRAGNPQQCREGYRKWREKQRLLGRRDRKCPDGVRRYLTDEEYNARYGINQQLPLF